MKTVCIAGSTHFTTQMALSLQNDPRFSIIGVITPAPKPQGRKKDIVPNPLDQLATSQALPCIHVEKRIDATIQEKIVAQLPRPDILLVVDFGYIIPNWLLEFPTVAPLNIHPSKLPAYRGSSPAQYALTFGEHASAATLMVMDEKLDHGPVIAQLPFLIEKDWTASDYYEHAFSLVAQKLPDLIINFCEKPLSTPQPEESPTPVASHLQREDGFIPLESLLSLLKDKTAPLPVPFLARLNLPTSPKTLFNLWRGLHPWPGLWTKKNENGKSIRVKLLDFSLTGSVLQLKTVQFEGRNPQKFTKI